MRIAQVAPLYESVPPRGYGGTERVVHYLTEELVRMGHEVTLFASGDSITSAELVPCAPRSLRTDSSAPSEFVIPPHRTLAEIEKMAILQTLQRTNWNKQEAAQILGLYRPTLYSKMKKHEIQDGGKSGARRTASV